MYNIGKMKKSAKKKLLIISLVFTLCFSACGTDKVVETEAEKIVEAVTNKDMKAVETIILGTGNFVTDEKLADFFEDSENASNGIITKIVEQDSIKIKETKEYIAYEITAPELMNIFEDVMKEENLTEESFEEYIYNYIAAAEKTKCEVKVPYNYEEGIFTADYSTQEFMNGITGNLITAYQKLMKQMIRENSEEDIVFEYRFGG